MALDSADVAPLGTEIVLLTFRANGLLLAEGDTLAAEQGLTSARWQVLGAIAIAQRPLTVPQIARSMGLTRQSVHASVQRLLDEALVERVPNADHQRSPLVSLTQAGRHSYEWLDRMQTEWVTRLTAGLSRRDLEATSRVLAHLCDRLEAGSLPPTRPA